MNVRCSVSLFANQLGNPWAIFIDVVTALSPIYVPSLDSNPCQEWTLVPGVCNYRYVPLGHMGSIVMRIGTTTTINPVSSG